MHSHIAPLYAAAAAHASPAPARQLGPHLVHGQSTKSTTHDAYVAPLAIGRCVWPMCGAPRGTAGAHPSACRASKVRVPAHPLRPHPPIAAGPCAGADDRPWRVRSCSRLGCAGGCAGGCAAAQQRNTTRRTPHQLEPTPPGASSDGCAGHAARRRATHEAWRAATAAPQSRQRRHAAKPQRGARPPARRYPAVALPPPGSARRAWRRLPHSDT